RRQMLGWRLDSLHERGELGAVVHRKLRQHLPVDLDAVRGQGCHQSAVRESVLAGGRVDSHDPQAMEIALPVAAVPILVRQRVEQRFLRGFDQAMTGAGMARRLFQDLLVAPACSDASFYAGHDSPPSGCVRKVGKGRSWGPYAP